MLSRWRGSWRWFCCRCTNPDKDSAVFIDSQSLGIDDFFFEILHVVVVEVNLTLQSPIGHTSSTAEEVYHLVEYRVEVHYRPSSNASSKAFASCRSAVSKPSVNQPYTGTSSARAAACLPCCCQRRAKLVVARSSSNLACCVRAISRA